MSTIEHFPAKRTGSKHFCVPLYPNESTDDLRNRSLIIKEALNQFDRISQEFIEEAMHESAASVILTIDNCWQENGVLNSDFASNYPAIVKVDLSLVLPHLDYGKFLAAALTLVDGPSEFSLAQHECRPDDSFSSIMAKILPQLKIQEEFNEFTAKILDKNVQRLIMCFRHSYRIRGAVLETLLEYFKQFKGSRVIFIIDSAVAYERISARFKYACQLMQPNLITSSELLFQDFVVYLIDRGYQHCIMTPEVLDFLTSQCASAQISLPFVQKIIKYCVYRKLGTSLMNMSLNDFSSHIPNENAKKLTETFATLKADVYHRSCNNAVLFSVTRCISDELKTPFQLMKEMLAPGFGTKAFLDRFYDRLKKMTPDEFVQILLRIKQSCDKLKGCFKTVEVISELGGLHSDGIKSKAATAQAVNRLQDIILNTDYLNTDHPLMHAVMFYDVAELESLFFTDIGKLIQDSLKRPELYLGIPKSSGRKTRKPVVASIPDSARLYKLTLEWQRMINLHDLYFQFQSQVHTEPRKPKPDQQKGYMARFMQCVNELELVGVWSSHGRKRDTYERRNFTDAPDEDSIEA